MPLFNYVPFHLCANRGLAPILWREIFVWRIPVALNTINGRTNVSPLKHCNVGKQRCKPVFTFVVPFIWLLLGQFTYSGENSPSQRLRQCSITNTEEQKDNETMPCALDVKAMICPNPMSGSMGSFLALRRFLTHRVS